MSYDNLPLHVSPRLGYSSHPRAKEYTAWREMKSRCLDPNDRDYPRYGGRGITVQPSWLLRGEGFRNFLASVGPAPSPAHTLDRRDNSRGYQDGNCRWVPHRENVNNRDVTLWLCLDGECAPLMDWVRATGISTSTIRGRLDSGWTEAEALLTPVQPRRKPATASA